LLKVVLDFKANTERGQRAAYSISGTPPNTSL